MMKNIILILFGAIHILYAHDPALQLLHDYNQDAQKLGVLYAFPPSLHGMVQDCCVRMHVDFPKTSCLCADFSEENSRHAYYSYTDQKIVICRNKSHNFALLRFLLCHELGHYKSQNLGLWHSAYETQEQIIEDEKYAEIQALIAINCQTCLQQALHERWQIPWANMIALAYFQGYVSYDQNFIQRLIQEYNMPSTCIWCQNSLYENWIYSLDQL